MFEASLAEGTAVGRYQIRSLLGAGGMGEVYRAWEASLERLVALKILRPELTGDAHRVQRFVTEAKAASALNHPAIVSIYEIGDDRGGEAGAESLHYIAMELVEGVTLDEWVRQAPPLSSLLAQLATVAEGLAKAHDRGIIHRDLKPENIMITAEGHPKVLDFGVAKLIDIEARGVSTAPASPRATLTETRSLVGTAQYMSPEQIEGTAADHRADIFSFGCVIYECLTGRSPFAGVSKAETLHNVVHRDPAPLDLGKSAMASALQRLVDRCLAKDREARYDSARDLGLDLLEAAALAPRAQRPRKRILSVGSRLRKALGLAGVVLAAFFLLGPVAGWVSSLIASIAPSSHPQIQKLEQMLAMEADRSQSLSAALSEREGEIGRRAAEIERLKADLEHSERLRGDLETSYRTLLSGVEEHLRRNNTERSKLSERAATAEADLQRLRQVLENRSAQQARLGAIQRDLSPIVATRLEARGLVLSAPGIFRHSRSRIEPSAFGFLQRLADQLTAHPEIAITIEGHTDRTGSADDNLDLSQERADRVRDHLVMLGVEPERIATIGRGELFPAFSDATEEGRQANRRIEVILSH